MPGLRRVAMIGFLGVVLVSCSTSAAPARLQPQRGCVSHDDAVRIWTEIDKRLNAIELDGRHTGVTDVATGTALAMIQQYLQQNLVAAHLTEHEVDQLVSLTVIDPGCNDGTLDVRVTEKLVTDDYLRADGSVDHRDQQVGMTLHIEEFFVRQGGRWKESDFQDLDQGQSQAPQLV